MPNLGNEYSPGSIYYSPGLVEYLLLLGEIIHAITWAALHLYEDSVYQRWHGSASCIEITRLAWIRYKKKTEDWLLRLALWSRNFFAFLKAKHS